MIPYVQSATSPEAPPPYHFPGVTVNAFVWEARMGPIQDYCDRQFNLGSVEERGFVYRPVAFWPYAMLLFIDYPVMIIADQSSSALGGQLPFSDRGVVSQTEVFVALPVARYGATLGKLLTQSTVETALPFIVVGNGVSAVCGREMLGLEKLVAEIKTGEGVFPDSFKGGIRLPGWRTWTAGVMQEMLPFLEVETAPSLPTFRGSPPETSLATLAQSREAGWMLEEMVNGSNFVEWASLGLAPTTMRTVSLKQIRDAVDPAKALYQSLVTCRSYYYDITNLRMYNENDVTITFHDTGSFHEVLQVFLQLDSPTPTGKPITFRPKAGFRFNADIDFDQMRTIHTFPVDRGPGLPPVAASSDLIARWLRPLRGFFGPVSP
jgi:hypothetical protein